MIWRIYWRYIGDIWGVFHSHVGTAKWMIYRKSYSEMNDVGVPPILGNLHFFHKDKYEIGMNLE